MFLHALVTALIFIGVLFVLVIAHEWGHFFVARRCGVKVHEFGFGFPPRIAAWKSKKSGTEYTANWIPLGGFVRLKGEDGSEKNDVDSFGHKPMWQRLAILFAGVFMNFVVGFLLFTIVYLRGMDAPVAFAGVGAQLSNQRAIVTDALVGSPAGAAGVLAGDQIVAINGVTISAAADAVTNLKLHGADEIIVTVARGAEKKELHMRAVDLPEGVHGIGVRMTDMAFQKYPVGAAVHIAALDTAGTATMIFRALGDLIKTLFKSGKVGADVAGPVGIAQITGQVARTGITPLLQLMAILSINLGVLNVLPFPALDGGRALFVVLQKFFGKRMKDGVEQAAHLIGFALLMALVIVVTVRDVIHLVK